MSDLELCTEPERRLLRQIAGHQGVATPSALAKAGGWRSVQNVARCAGGLEDMGMIRIVRLPNERYPKMTYYELSGQGEKALAEEG